MQETKRKMVLTCHERLPLSSPTWKRMDTGEPFILAKRFSGSEFAR